MNRFLDVIFPFGYLSSGLPVFKQRFSIFKAYLRTMSGCEINYIDAWWCRQKVSRKHWVRKPSSHGWPTRKKSLFCRILHFIADSRVQRLPFIWIEFTLVVTVKPFLMIAGTSDMERFHFIQATKMTSWQCDLYNQKHLRMCREIITALPARQSVQQVMLASTVYGPHCHNPLMLTMKPRFLHQVQPFPDPHHALNFRNE